MKIKKIKWAKLVWRYFTDDEYRTQLVIGSLDKRIRKYQDKKNK
jgi:hypothetical protein